MKKRILQIVHSLPVAGTEILAAKMARNFKSEYDTAICCLDEKGKLAGQLEREGIAVFCIDRKPGMDIGAIRRLRKIFKEFQPTIVHAHQYTPFFYSALAKTRKIKLLFTEHGRHYPDVVSRKRRLFNRWLKYRADWVGAVCQFSKQRLADYEGFSNTRIEVIYNGVLVDGIDYGDPFQTREKFQIPKDAKVVGFAGGLRPIKNPELLLNAFSKIWTQFSNLYLIFVGDGELRPRLEERAHHLGLKERVRFCGVRYPLYPFLKIMDLFVLPSFSEGASVTLLEALAAKIPVVVTDVGGNREIVENQVSGIVVPSENEEKLAEGIAMIYEKPNWLSQFAENGYRQVREKFTEKKMMDQYRQAYEKVS